MRGRCYDPNDKSYENYGGRGIGVCSRWNDFELFLQDVGKRPSPEHSIEREDVNGDYEPSNVCWATSKEQAANTTRTAFVIFEGRRCKLLDLATDLGVSSDTLHKRALRGTYGLAYAR